MHNDEYKFVTNYKENEKYLSSFCKLAANIFGLVDFKEWFNKGYCNENYICYSYVHNDEVIANVSVNKFDLIIEGKLNKAIQLGTVMTHKDYRNNGLIRSIMKKIFSEYMEKYDFIYLFANDSVLNFYTKFGFKKVYERIYGMDTRQINLNHCNFRKLNIEVDTDKTVIANLCKNRKPISKRLGVINDEWPLRVYCNYMYKDNLYYMEEEGIIIILKRQGKVVNLYDILSENEIDIDIDNIIEKIAVTKDEKINFHFIVESSKYYIEQVEKSDKRDTLFVKPIKTSLENNIAFPLTSHT